MEIAFTKMQGIGNDFVVIDATKQTINLTPSQIQRMGDRHFGIGFDQLLIIAPSTRPEVDFNYHIYNADGSTSGQCGNGARCLAHYIYSHHLSSKRHLTVATTHALLKLHFENSNTITVDMGKAEFAPSNIPILATKEAPTYSIEIAGYTWQLGAVSMGNPHAVTVVANVATAPVQEAGAKISTHPFFPEQVNVGFMQIIDRENIQLRVYERGVGETLACGSGACAAMVIGRTWNLLDEKVTVHLPGGDLIIQWKNMDSPVLMTGPAAEVFSGVWKL